MQQGVDALKALGELAKAKLSGDESELESAKTSIKNTLEDIANSATENRAKYKEIADVLHTSPDILEPVENTFIRRYPTASAPTEIMAIAASPLIFVLCPVRRSKTAQITVTGITKSILLLMFSTEAMAIAPNATWESPSPIKEKRFRTSVTPRREEHSAIKTPTINAYHTNGY